jgi:hypothetical protein
MRERLVEATSIRRLKKGSHVDHVDALWTKRETPNSRPPGSAAVLMNPELRESVKEVEEGSHSISRHGKLDGLLATQQLLRRQNDKEPKQRKLAHDAELGAALPEGHITHDIS